MFVASMGHNCTFGERQTRFAGRPPSSISRSRPPSAIL